ncbi:MAG: 16S rRNA (cytosine(1402)-N(4))-methyltransferase RsmH [Phycisphaeraceae bacterium]|nr:16S rRNA (cytosine(1402)-N(4))-methyltransferase RsmH [Phycisphaeraceae bacterium]
MSEPLHIPVLLQEVIHVLRPQPGEVYVDATAGLGGHAAAVAPLLGPAGLVVLNDVDPDNLYRAKARVEGCCAAPPWVLTLEGNFADLARRLTENKIRADMLLADLGFASNQMDDAGRGLSFMREGPLDMRLDPTLPVSAADLVQTLSESELAAIFRDYGEEPGASRVARKIVATRRTSPILTTAALAAVVRSVLGNRTDRGIDPSTRVFQALRIAVNDELGVLDALLAGIGQAAQVLSRHDAKGAWCSPGARIAVISFHSLEDRMVKRAFSDLARRDLAQEPLAGALRASDAETRANPRARSAKLRALRLGRAPEKELGRG